MDNVYEEALYSIMHRIGRTEHRLSEYNSICLIRTLFEKKKHNIYFRLQEGYIVLGFYGRKKTF